jgi:hypothetical protein
MTHYTAEQLASFPWIVSTDTLKTEALLESFWSAAEQIAAIKGAPLDGPLVADLERLAGEDSNAADWADEEASATLERLTDYLGDLAPVGFGFGSSEGDGACFGFWLSEDWADALEHLGLDGDDPAGWAALIAELEADGIDPDNVEDSYQGRAEGWSEERAGADYAQQLFEDSGLQNASCDGWPFTCIDWDVAWRDLEMGDGYRLHDLGGGDWLVFRSC